MHSRDYLHDIPLKFLKAIADTLDIEVEYRARIKLVNAIDRAFLDGKLTERLIRGLSEKHRNALALVAFSYHAGVTENTLLRKLEKHVRISRQEARMVVHDLLPLVLVGGIVHSNSVLYFCPLGIAEHVRELLIREVVSVPDATHSALLSSPANLLEDIYSFLAEVYKENIPLTMMGRVRKTVLERIFNGSLTCSDTSLHFSPEQRNSFVIDYLKTRNLILFEQHEARISPILKGWLELSITDRLQDIVSFAFTYKNQDSTTIIILSGLLSEMRAGTSFYVTEFVRFLDTETPVPGGYKRLETRVRAMLAILNQLGILSCMNGRFTMTVFGERYFSGKTLPLDENMDTCFTVQPNFDVIVGPELKPVIRFTLELFATRKNRDTVLTYIITQEGVARARERGMSTDEVMRFFHEHSRNPVPQNVRFSIESWANSYGSIFFENVMLMRCRNADICDSVVHSPDIAPYVMEQLSDTVLVITSKHIPTIMEYLKKEGYLPEAFEETVPDTVSGEFAPARIAEIVEVHYMPKTPSNFIFPHHIFSDSNDDNNTP